MTANMQKEGLSEMTSEGGSSSQNERSSSDFWIFPKNQIFDPRNIFARETLPPRGHSIFLAGPTPRRGDVASWRPEAIEIFRQKGFEHCLIIPEDRNGPAESFDYDDQVLWELHGLRGSRTIMFWFARTFPDMPGLTTNDEWGYWKTSGKVTFGAPPWAVKTSYQRWWAEKLCVPTASSLEELVDKTITLYRAHSEM